MVRGRARCNSRWQGMTNTGNRCRPNGSGGDRDDAGGKGADVTSSNIADLVRSAAAKFADRPALISKEGTRTWADFDRAADAGAAFLIERGLQPGARLLIQLPTSEALALALTAGARAGLVLVPVDPTRTDAERIGSRVQAGLIISDQSGGEVTSADVRTWWKSTATAARTAIGGEDIALLGRASRTDQAVMLSHRAILAAVRMIGETTRLQLRPDDRVVLVLPLFHLAGFVTAFLPLTLVGGAAVIPDVPEVTGPNVSGTSAWRAYVEGVLGAIHDHHVTVVPGAPSLYRLLLRAENLERSMSTVRLMTSGASPLNPEDFSAMRSRTGSPVWEGYGISEAASVVTSSLMTGGAKARSVGLPLAGVELRIEGAPDATDGMESAAATLGSDDLLADFDDQNEPGRISIRGQNLFSGYWPDGSGGPDADGWFTTADVGYLDDAGELHLIDRASETVVIAGFTVYPREIEAALLTHPYVRDVAVIGLPGRAGQALVAIIVANRGTTPTEADLTEHLSHLLPTFKRPTTYHLTTILPRTELGRLDRDAVRAKYAAAAGLDLEVPTVVEQKLTVVAAETDSHSPPQAAVAEDTAAGHPTDDQVERELPPEPEVMDVSQLDQLGSRLPGVQERSRRSTYDTDDDLFGEDLFGEDLLGSKPADVGPVGSENKQGTSEPPGAAPTDNQRSDR